MSKTLDCLQWIDDHGPASSADMARKFEISVNSALDWARGARAQGVLVKRQVGRGVVYHVSPTVKL
jgi:hypothetical protein